MKRFLFREKFSREIKRTLYRAIICGFFLASSASLFPFAAASAQLPENIVRLHVVANSNSGEDQAVKLLVRDAVLEEASRWYQEASSMEEASAALCVHLESIGSAAQAVLREQGFSYSARAELTEMYFPTRSYETFTLPAGTYRTLRITLGEGEGKNWWCVVFPALCLPAAQERGDDAFALLPGAEREIVQNPKSYRVKFKAVEWYEELKRWLESADS